MVVDVAGLRQGFAELLRERERCCRGGGRRPRLCVAALPPPLYIGPLGGAGPGRWDLGGLAPPLSPPINSGGVGGQPHPSSGAALPSNSYSFSSSIVLGEALPENHELHHHHAVVLPEFSLNFSSPLAGSRRRRRPRVVRVLNAEVPSVRHLDQIFRDLNRREYDCINRVLVTLPLSDLQGCEDALPLSLVASIS